MITVKQLKNWIGVMKDDAVVGIDGSELVVRLAESSGGESLLEVGELLPVDGVPVDLAPMTIKRAIAEWYTLANTHAGAGAYDTEPRGVFEDLVQAYAVQTNAPLPSPSRDEWALYDSAGAHVVQELNEALHTVCRAIDERPHKELREAFEYQGWDLP